MSLNRQPVGRSRPMLEAYGTGLTTAEIQWAARGWGALRVFLKERGQPESSFVQQSDWQTAGQVRLAGLTEGGLYDVRFVNQAGRTWDLKLHLPRKILPSGSTTWRCTAPVVDPVGRLYAVIQGSNDAYAVIRRSDDGGQNWLDVRTNLAAFHSRMYYHDGKLYGTTYASWATNYRDRLFYIPAQLNYTGDVLLAFTDPMFNPDPTPEGGSPARDRVQVYPWGFEPRGPYWIICAAGKWVPEAGEQTMTADNCNNRIYYTNNNWQTRGTMIAPPTGGVYGKHTHSVCWNPVSQCYFISIGDYYRKNYLVSGDLQKWQQVADGFYRLTGLPSGASIGVTWCPDGSFLAGNDDIKYGHITRFRADGSWEIALVMPEFHSAMVWDIWAYDDGEVWATFRQDNSNDSIGSVMASQDWGRTWRTIYRSKLSAFTPAYIGGCHETRRLHGDWVVVDQDLGRVPEPAYAWRRLG